MSDQNPHIIDQENAAKIWNWLNTRQGLYVWKSANLSNPAASWTSPATSSTGAPTRKPTWEAEDKPARHITDPADVIVSEPKEVKRFHVALRMGSQGFMVKCTDASSKRIEREVEKAYEKTGKPSYYRFDYETQEAVIYIDDILTPLLDYARKNNFTAFTPVPVPVPAPQGENVT